MLLFSLLMFFLTLFGLYFSVYIQDFKFYRKMKGGLWISSKKNNLWFQPRDTTVYDNFSHVRKEMEKNWNYEDYR